jgi:hypothetical protein
MKKPYLTQFQRQLITAGTLTGDCTMLGFRLKQLEKAIIERPLGSIFYKFLHNVIKRFNDL